MTANRTESESALKRELSNTRRDNNAPENSQFPEEYTMEAPTGLVKEETVQEATGKLHLDKQHVDKAVEHNRRQMDHPTLWDKITEKLGW